MGAMGVSVATLPKWDDIQVITAQLTTKPLLEDQPVTSELIIGPEAKQPLQMMARDCGHHALQDFNKNDLATWDRFMANLTGIDFSGFKVER